MALHHSVVAYRLEQDRLLADGVKRCTKCLEIKPTSAFSKNSRTLGGYANNCTVCQSIRWRIRHQKDLVDVAAKHAAATEQRQLAADGLRKCATCSVIKPLAVDFKHRESKWARFKDDCADCARTKLNDTKTIKHLQSRKTRRKNRIVLWARKSIDAHRKRGFLVNVTVADLANLVDDRGNGRCYYTGVLVKVGYGATIDLKNPSGPFEPDNICLCTHACNSTKQAMNETEFIEYLNKNPLIRRHIILANRDRLKFYYTRNVPLSVLKNLVKQWRNQSI